MASVSFRTKVLEKTLDYLPHVTDAVFAAIGSPLRMAFKAGLALTLPLALFRPDIYFSFSVPRAREITRQSVKEGFYDHERLPESVRPLSKVKLRYLFKVMEDIGQKLHLKNKLIPFSSEEQRDSGTCASDFFSVRPMPFYVDPSLGSCTKKRMACEIAHEASHAAYNHIAWKHLFSLSILITDIAACYSGYYYLLPCIEAAGSVMDNFISRQFEKMADSKAVEILGTNVGAIEYLHWLAGVNNKRRTEDTLAFNAKSASYFKTDCPWTNFLRKIFTVFSDTVVVSEAAPDGTNRYDLEHPSITERLANISVIRPRIS